MKVRKDRHSRISLSVRRMVKQLASGYLFRTIKHKLFEFILLGSTKSQSFNTSLKPGVTITGYIQGEFGVGEAVRSSIHALGKTDIPYQLNNIRTSNHRYKDSSFENFTKAESYFFNLIHVNAAQIPHLLIHKGNRFLRGKYNIGYWFWELANFPKEFASSFSPLHEIWVASSFCQESIAAVSPVPVKKITLPILFNEEQVQPNRKYFDIPKDKFVFGFAFDYLSVAERKNPSGLIHAFKNAFSQNDDALLVIKTINAKYAPMEKDGLMNEARGCNIMFHDGHLSHKDMLCLMSSFDSFVSLHRSEGFGLGLAQAMAMQKPVIATGYSGNMEFMNDRNSFLVKYKLSELTKDIGPYAKGNVWAEPDKEHAAELMRFVFENPSSSQVTALRAKKDIQSGMTVGVAGAEMKNRLHQILADRGINFAT